jgi:hypothetical protein
MTTYPTPDGPQIIKGSKTSFPLEKYRDEGVRSNEETTMAALLGQARRRFVTKEWTPRIELIASQQMDIERL